MRTIKYKKENIKEIKEALLDGKIIAFPTDTVFGLGCIYDNKQAIEEIYKAKGRREDKPLPMMCNSLEMINKVAYVNEKSEKIINKFVPGPITLIFKKKNLEDYITNGLDTIGIRVPNDKWILELIKEVNKPLLVTSANLSDKGSLLKYEDVYKDMNERIDGIVLEDATGYASSTIVSVIDEIKILREGPISKEEIMKAINE